MDLLEELQTHVAEGARLNRRLRNELAESGRARKSIFNGVDCQAISWNGCIGNPRAKRRTGFVIRRTFQSERDGDQGELAEFARGLRSDECLADG